MLTSTSIAGETESQRSVERNRRAIAGAVVGLVVRGSSFVLVLITVPLTLDYLGPARFGLWMTIASVASLLSATDLGIGNGVLNNVSHAFGRNDEGAARIAHTSGLIVLSGLAVFFGFLFLLAYPYVPWASLYNVANDPMGATEAGPATAAFIATFLLGMPLSLAAQARSAFQETFVQGAFTALANVTTIFLLFIAISARAALPGLVVALTIGPVMAGAVNTFILLRIQRPWLAPRRSEVSMRAIRTVMSVSFAFMALQIAYVIGFSLDRLIAAQIVGPVGVAEYSIVHRLFAIPTGLAAIALVPLWPAYREAIARADIGWVRLTMKRSLFFILATTVPVALVLTLAGPLVVRVWTQEGLTPSMSLYPALGAFTIALALANVFQMFLNGAQAMRFQIATMALMALVNLVVSIYLASEIGVAGVAIGSTIAVVTTLLLPATFYVPQLLRRLEGLSVSHAASRDRSVGSAE